MYTVIPELQYWFNNFLLTCNLNKTIVPLSSDIDSSWMVSNSFIRLLFDDNWPKTLISYKYKYKENTSKASWPLSVQNRMGIYPLPAKYFECDDNGINYFSLIDCDLVMLDNLLAYRISDSTNLLTISIDSTMVLTTSLSKLIYKYLDLQINDNYLPYNTDTLISSDGELLASMYELYVVEIMFNYVNSKKIL